MGGNELKYIHEAFDANWVAPLGPNVDGFEKDIEKFLNEDVKVAALSAGTAAIHLALIECGVGYGDEVLCQTMTFSATANPIAYQGATPVFVDSEVDTWNLCPIALEEAIQDRIAKGKKPKAILAVHLYGMPYKVDEVSAIAEKYDIPLEINLSDVFEKIFYRDRKFNDLSISEARKEINNVRYPNANFWKVASNYNVKVLYGIDAHHKGQIMLFDKLIQLSNEIIGNDIIKKLQFINEL